MISHEEEIRLAKAGKYDELIKAWQNPLLYFIQKRVGPYNSDVEDMAQEIWINVREGLKKPNSSIRYDYRKGRFFTWVLSFFAKQVISKWLRDRNLRRQLIMFEHESRVQVAEKSNHTTMEYEDCTNPDPATAMENEEERRLRFKAFTLNLTEVFRCGGYPHQLLAFAYSKLIYGKGSPRGIEGKPKIVDDECGWKNLFELSESFIEEYAWLVDLSAYQIRDYLQPIRSRLFLTVRELFEKDQASYAQFERTELADSLVADTCLKDYYSKSGPSASISDWCIKVERRLRLVIGVDEKDRNCNRCKLRHVPPCSHDDRITRDGKKDFISTGEEPLVQREGAFMEHIHPRSLVHYLRNDLSADNLMAVDEHLCECDECLDKVRALRYLRSNFDSIWKSWTAEEHGRVYKQWRLAKALREAHEQQSNSESIRTTALKWLKSLRTKSSEFAVDLLIDGKQKLAILASAGQNAFMDPSDAYEFFLSPVRIGAGAPDTMADVEKHRKAASLSLLSGKIDEAKSHLEEVVEIDSRAAQAAGLDIIRDEKVVGRIQVDSRRTRVSFMYWPAREDHPQLALLIPEHEEKVPMVEELRPVEGANYLLAEFTNLADSRYTIALNPMVPDVTLEEKQNDISLIGKQSSTDNSIGPNYEILQVVGKGAFGVVYKVYDRVHERVYAVKTFRDRFLLDKSVRDMFRKEALLWNNLREHPFVLPAHWVEDFSGRTFVVLGYVEPDEEGRVTLQDHLQGSEEPIEPQRALNWGIQFCHGMEHANACGIKCHRDIKPSNILITQNEILKITDFGMAVAAGLFLTEGDYSTVFSDEKSFALSILKMKDRKSCGTPGYISPEVFRGEDADTRSDIYSFGLVLWQMAAGSSTPPYNPFCGQNKLRYLEEVYEQQKTGWIPPIESPFWPVIQRCLKFEPLQRYESFQELRKELEEILLLNLGEEVLVPDPDKQDAIYLNNKGASLSSLGYDSEAIVCYDKALQIEPGSVESWINKAHALSGLNRYEEAIFCLDNALKIAPEFAPGLSWRGSILEYLDRHEEAITWFDRALEIDPLLDEAWNNKSGSLKALGLYEESMRCVKKALEINPQSATAWNNKGSILSVLGRQQASISCIDNALEINPLYAAAWQNKGNVLNVLGRYEEAVSHYEKAIEINPKLSKAWENKGCMLDELGQYHEALESFGKALEIDPTSFKAWNNKGSILYKLGRQEDATICFEKALEIDPQYAPAWNNKATMLLGTGRIDESIVCFDKSLEIDAQFAQAWQGKGIAHKSLGRYEEAISHFERALEINPKLVQAWEHMGSILDILGHHREAVACFERIIEMRSEHKDAWYLKGNSLYELGCYEEAISCFEKALINNPQFTQAWFNKGSALRKLERDKEAVSCFKQAIQMNPQDVDAWYSMGSALAASECYEEAIRCFEKALEINPEFSMSLFNKGLALFFLDRFAEAIECFAKYLNSNQQDPKAWILKALAEDTLGQLSDAAGSYRVFVDLAPTGMDDKLAFARERLEKLKGF